MLRRERAPAPCFPRFDESRFIGIGLCRVHVLRIGTSWHSIATAGDDSRSLQGLKIPLGFRADILMAETVILEIKAVPAFIPAHEAQLQTYLRMSGIPVGLLLNFHAVRLKDGLRRFVG
jgi:PD-(D/E)XK nuclease superfamily protein